ncbi:MAG: outer membrane beta-barrel protein [Bacteroidia bacterium]|nr:outer membrane beta-barrel protein [Bacteroidia bacterium]
MLTALLMISVLSMANAQFKKIGGGPALSSGFPFHQQTGAAKRSGIIALSFKGIYEISLPLHISPSFTIFYPHITNDLSTKTTVSSMMFDINGHYVFNSPDKFEFYGLAGLDILFANKKEKHEDSPSFKESDNALGINLGVGTYMKITEQFDIYGEAKYVFNNKYNQFMLNVGILLNIDCKKKHENSGN